MPTGRTKDNTERVTGFSRRTRERKQESRKTRKTRKQIVKWNQMTALRFQTEGRHQTAQTSLKRHNQESKSLHFGHKTA